MMYWPISIKDDISKYITHIKGMLHEHQYHGEVFGIFEPIKSNDWSTSLAYYYTTLQTLMIKKSFLNISQI